MDVLVSTPELQDLIVKGATPAELQRAAAAGGGRSVRAAALEFVAAGRTTLEEVERVLGEAEPEKAAPAADSPRVLLVDDDAVVRGLARGVLERNGLAVSEAGDGRVALDLLARDPGFSLVVLDLDMPELGGIDVLRQVRQTMNLASLPVVVLTSASDEASEVGAMDAGADDYIRKPIDPPRFVSRVRAVLRRAATPA
jgi:CheY-like chemotaxis protein